jgi:hypothetical protein
MRVRLGVLLVVAVVAVTGLVGVVGAGAAPVARSSDPVVLTGAQLPKLVNTTRAPIVGFRWTGSAWVQFPVQIDERAVVNFGKIYNNVNVAFYGSDPKNFSALVYTGGNTFTGNDPNNKFDADDELVFMARDAGVPAPAGSNPAGTLAGSGVQVKVTDPLDPSAEGYAYLFRKAPGSTLAQGARVRYVKVAWRILSGAYKTHYVIANGANPENSLVTGATYKHHFSDRWATDQISITAPGATGVDILDRHKALFSPGYCGRSEDTFDTTIGGPNEGAFVTMKAGPVRVIRSYIGANSGPNTQRTHFFYDRREDIVTNLRVHAIPSIMDFFDYSAAAKGMTYRNSVNPAGVTIDGNPDALTAGAPTWEQVTGPQGTLNQVGTLETTGFTPTATNYYLDHATPSGTAETQCTGDASAYGSSGSYVTSAIPSTDPGIGGTASLTGTRVMFFEGPGGTAADAANRRDQVLSPLASAVSSAP